MDPERSGSRKIKGKISSKFNNINSEGLVTNIMSVGLNSIIVSVIIVIAAVGLTVIIIGAVFKGIDLLEGSDQFKHGGRQVDAVAGRDC